MKRLVLALLSLLILAAPASALIGGRHLTGSPDVVRLVFTNGWVCTGTFIDPYTILTAAHCLSSGDNAEPIQIKAILSVGDQEIGVRQTEIFIHPEFASQSWPAFDVGLLKTSRYANFSHQFNLDLSSTPTIGTAKIFGCGKTDLTSGRRERKSGDNKYLKIGSVVFFLGGASGESANIAPNDSGGPITESSTGEIIAVATTTTAIESKSLGLPILSTGTSVAAPENRLFIQSHLGPENK